jgi:hypothetical protein
MIHILRDYTKKCKAKYNHAMYTALIVAILYMSMLVGVTYVAATVAIDIIAAILNTTQGIVTTVI